MNGFGFQVYEDSTMAVMIADWTHLAQNVIPETGDHGYDNLKAFIPMSTNEAFRVYDSLHFAHVVLSAYGFHAFEGRIEDANPKNDGIEIIVLGYWRAFRDLLYTALWIDKRISEWRLANENDYISRIPEKYTSDKQNRLYLTLKKNEKYTTSADVGAFVYIAPDDTEKNIAVLSFNYDVTIPTNWKINIRSFAEGFTSPVTEVLVLTGNGSNQTGSTSETITANKQIVMISLYNDTGGDYTNTGETDDWYAEFTNIVVKTTSSANIYSDEIVGELVSHVNGYNSSQISGITSLIESPASAILNAVYEDERPANIIKHLCNLGDGTNKYEAGVWEGQRLHFRQVGSQGRTWYVDIADITLQSTVEDLYNSVYAKYSDESNATLRTALSSDASSISKYGVTRQDKVDVKTTSGTEAGNWRDTYLEDHKDITPKTKIVVNRIFNEGGAVVPIWYPRASDTIVIRNLPPTAGEAVDKIRRFICTRTRLDIEKGELTLTPAEPIDSVDILLAKHEVTYVNG